MSGLDDGRFRARRAVGAADLARVEVLRAVRFRGDPAARDLDAFDVRAIHVMVEETATGRLACCFRLLPVEDVGASYSAQFYGLEALASYPGRMVEMGRFCVAEGEGDPAVLRLAWGALAAEIEAQGVDLLFGCASFQGLEAETHAEAFARDRFGAERMRMTVIDKRTELIAFYERRGYLQTGEREPFPYGEDRFGLPRTEDLEFVVLIKELGPTSA